ncbi:uncharacterized protein otoa [Alosa pseudoharengus]|uniref:uncharacterized protein otoa n=1 Tax=Alosa pseudoharengus TaxID=34774 RepID=UPI003F88E5D8
MQTLRGKALVFLLLADLAIAVMSQEMMGNVMSEGNATTMGIPRMTPEFKEMAKKLMLKCSKMGYQPPAMPEPAYNGSVEEEEMMPQNPFSLFPSLLSSLPPIPPLPALTSSRSARLSNSSVDRPDMEADWNVTEQQLNATTLTEMIDIMKNSTDQPRCFMQTFISPVAWSAIMQNGPWVQIEDLSKLLWAARPYLESMPPHYIDLPPRPDQLHMAEMMKMFSEVFSSLSEEQRDQITEWVKASVLENEFNCTHSSPTQRPKRPQPWSMGAKPPPGGPRALGAKPPPAGPGALGALLHDPNSLLDSEGAKKERGKRQIGRQVEKGVEEGKGQREGGSQGMAAINGVTTGEPRETVSRSTRSSQEVKEKFSDHMKEEEVEDDRKEKKQPGIGKEGEEEKIMSSGNGEEMEQTGKKEPSGGGAKKQEVSAQTGSQVSDTWAEDADAPGIKKREKDGERKDETEGGEERWRDEEKEKGRPGGKVADKEKEEGRMSVKQEEEGEREDEDSQRMEAEGGGVGGWGKREKSGNNSTESETGGMMETHGEDKEKKSWPDSDQSPSRQREEKEVRKEKEGGGEKSWPDSDQSGIGERGEKEMRKDKEGGEKSWPDSDQSGIGERGEKEVRKEKEGGGEKSWPDRDQSGIGERGKKEVRKDKEGGEKSWPDRDQSGIGERGEKEQSKEEKREGGKRWEDDKEEKREPEEEDGERGPKRVHCPQRQPWLNIKVLRIMGRFLSRLPPQEVKTIPSEELCQFFRSQSVSHSFQRVGAIKASLGRTLMSRLKTCFSSTQELLQHTASLGSLACFYDGGVSSLNETMSKGLLSQLEECQNSASKKVNMHTHPRTHISSSVLLSLGTVVRGVSSSELQTLPGEELLRGEERGRLEGVSRMMSTLQRKALLKGMRSSVNVSALVLSVPAPLLSSLSLSTLGRARLTSVEQLEGRKWTRAQSAFLLKKIVGRKLNRQHLRMLGQAIQGVTCEMIDSLIQNETMESVEALSQSSGWLDKTQIGCAARQLFAMLEQNRTDYFSSITEEELQSIPATMLIHLPARRIQGLPVSVCGVFLDKMAAVNLSCLPHSSPSRSALTQRALDCLGKNLSEVSSEEVQSLGPLLCELPPPQLRSLAPEVLNSTLLELAACPYIPRSYRAQLFSIVTDTFGQPSDWSEEDMMSLRPFLLLDNSTLRTLPNRPWLRSSLSDLMDSLPALSSTVVPEEFRPRPNLTTLRWKLFVLTTREDGQTSTPGQRRRRREAVAVGGPTSDLIEELGVGNVFWSPAQLANMSCETFTASSSQLGEIRDFSDEQLAALRQKVIESLGPVGQLNESQVLELGCVSQGFSAQELRQLNISTLDTLELLSTCRWTQAQRRDVWRGFQERTGRSAAQLQDLDIVGLGQFICGLEPEETQQLSNDSFREAAEAVGYTPCDKPQLESFKRKAVLVFGEPQSWSEGQVTSLGNILAGLEAAELQSLTHSVFSFIKASAIPLIPPKHLAALSVSQLQALGPDNAAMVTEAQRAELGAEQRKGLADALGVAYIRAGEPSSGGSHSSPVPQTGGSTSHTMGGIVLLLKPLLLLLLGFMLD